MEWKKVREEDRERKKLEREKGRKGEGEKGRKGEREFTMNKKHKKQHHSTTILSFTGFTTRGQCYKTFYGSKLRLFILMFAGKARSLP
jgi:hypothetical protein